MPGTISCMGQPPWSRSRCRARTSLYPISRNTRLTAPTAAMESSPTPTSCSVPEAAAASTTPTTMTPSSTANRRLAAARQSSWAPVMPSTLPSAPGAITVAMATSGHAVVIAGGGPTGLMLAGELALAGVDAAIVERRPDQELAGSRAGGLHARTIEVLDQRGIADRFLAEGQQAQVASFGTTRLDISDFPTRHPYGLGLWQNHIERILAGWVAELEVTIHRGRDVTGFAQDETGVDVELSDGTSLRAAYLVGCDGGRSTVRKAAGIDLPGLDAQTSWISGEVETEEEPPIGLRPEGGGIGPVNREVGGPPYGVVLK